MNIDWAVQMLRQGSKVYREDWNGTKMFIQMIFVEKRPVIHIYCEDGFIGAWAITHMDLLANDWNEYH